MHYCTIIKRIDFDSGNECTALVLEAGRVYYDFNKYPTANEFHNFELSTDDEFKKTKPEIS